MPEGNGAAQRPAEEQQGQSMIRTFIQMAAMYMFVQFAMKQFMPKPQTTTTTTTTTDSEGNTIQVPANTGEVPPYQLRPDRLDEGAVYNQIPQRIVPIWPEDSVIDIVVTVSPSFVPTPLKDTAKDRVVLDEKKFRIGNYSDKRVFDTTIQVPTQVQNNGTLFGHFYIGLTGSPLDPTQPGFDPATAYHFVYPMTQHIFKKKEVKTKKLLGNDDSDEVEEAAVEEPENAKSSGPTIANYYHPNHTLYFVPGTGNLVYPQSHPAIRHFLHLEPTGARDGSGQNSWYYPVLFVTSFWQLKTHMTLLNETVKTLPMRIDLSNLASWKFHAISAIELSSKEAAKQSAFGNSVPGGSDGSEVEMIKEILLDTNPILLGVTVVVSIAHVILETLAFGSDIAHYRKKKDNVGISVRSILANVFMQAVIFLYLVDQSANTSWMILGSQAIGILIELWKVTTIVNVRLRPAPPGSMVPYYISFEDKHKLSETEEKTKEYDEIAFKYMYVAGVPLLIAYGVYSLVYDTHKSWYSYVITTLVGSVYAYGFLMMVPSLYINYRLKSVAHMPAKAMMYKFLNTFIDDLFAFTIKMPFLHRLATFRDDIIFFIYLYQRWAYKVDYTRVNEFGQGGDDEEEEQAAKPSAVAAKGAKTAAVAAPSGAKATAKATGADTGAATKRK
ncbi:cleft lip and palate transmembrane 1 [Thozetella sp. PMI_491]|nr:cleft lip and palate transmembrane 1 [Thozetella sp. PMI_491]